jgi:hypothetical protein
VIFPTNKISSSLQNPYPNPMCAISFSYKFTQPMPKIRTDKQLCQSKSTRYPFIFKKKKPASIKEINACFFFSVFFGSIFEKNNLENKSVFFFFVNGNYFISEKIISHFISGKQLDSMGAKY